MRPMLGVLVTLVFTAAACLAVHRRLAKWQPGMDQAELIGISGLAGLGAAGLLTTLIGLLPGSLTGWGQLVVAGVVLVLAATGPKPVLPSISRPEPLALAAISLFVLLALQALVGVLAPSTMLDWDTLAYHLAIPLKWLSAGQITYLPASHHSSFPFVVGALNLLFLGVGGTAGAKAVLLAIFVLGGFAVFGLVRRWAGPQAAAFALAGFGGIPVVAWESGTAYIDAAHGLFAALACAYLLEAVFPTEAEDAPQAKSLALLGGVFLGLCLASKLTGLQVMAGLGAAGLAAGLLAGRGQAMLKAAVPSVLLALAIAAPYYIRTTLNTGNPVYPFFYSVFGGREWDEWRAKIYAEEQGTFGVPKQPANAGHAILGLAYQPGRYVNPAQTQGGGFPSGAVGFGVVAALLAAAASGRAGSREKALFAYVILGLGLWFFLSQQSRYLTILAIPAVIAAASASARMRQPWLAGGPLLVQAAATLAILYMFTTQNQLPAALGRVDAGEWQRANVPFARAAVELNKLPSGSKIALYDEVFGSLLQVPYMWANPGHSTLIPHEASQTGADYAQAMRGLGFTHIYVNLQYQPPDFRQAWIDALSGGPNLPQEQRDSMNADPNLKWKRLLSDAAQEGQISLVGQAGPGLLFSINPASP